MENRNNPEYLLNVLISGEYIKYYDMSVKYSTGEIYAICDNMRNNNTKNDTDVFDIINKCGNIMRVSLLNSVFMKIYSDKEDGIIYVNNFLKKFAENCNNILNDMCFTNILEEDMIIIKAPDSFITYAMLEFIRNSLVKYGEDTKINISCRNDDGNVIIFIDTESYGCNPVYSELPLDFVERHSAEFNSFFSEKSGLKCEYTEKSMKISVPLYTGKLIWGFSNRKVIPAYDEFSDYSIMLSGIKKQE